MSPAPLYPCASFVSIWAHKMCPLVNITSNRTSSFHSWVPATPTQLLQQNKQGSTSENGSRISVCRSNVYKSSTMSPEGPALAAWLHEKRPEHPRNSGGQHFRGVCVKNVWVAAVLCIVNAYWLSWMCEQQTIMSRCVLYSYVVFEYGVTTFRNSRWMNRRKRSIDIYWEITFSCFNNWGSIRSIYLIACINFGRCFK